MPDTKPYNAPLAPDYENLKFPTWLPEAVKESAIDYLKLRTRKIYSKQKNVPPLPRSLQKMLDAEQKKNTAIISLVTNPDMKSLWLEIANNHPGKLLLLIDAVAMGYSRWNAREILPPHQKKKLLKQIVGLIAQLQQVLRTDFNLRLEIAYRHGKLVEEQINDSLSLLRSIRDGRGVDTSHIRVVQNFLHDEPLTRMVGLEEMLSDLVEVLKRDEKILCKPPSQKNIPTKKRAKNAERNYMAGVIARAIEEIFGKKRYKDVSHVVSSINPDWPIISEDDIRKLAKK